MQSQPALAFICETESEWVGPLAHYEYISLRSPYPRKILYQHFFPARRINFQPGTLPTLRTTN